VARPRSADEREWIGTAPHFLPSVTCIQIVALENSKTLPTLLHELDLMGMMHLVSYTLRPPDPDGKEAGCFRGHVDEWKAALDRGCGTTLMLEEDAVFDGPVLQQSMKHSEAFLAARGSDFDILLLGWESNLFTGGHLKPSQRTKLAKTASQCIYEVHCWFETHAYIISQPMMRKYSTLVYNGTAIDALLEASYDRDRFYVVRPKLAFQSLHSSQAVSQSAQAAQTDGKAEQINETPLTFYRDEEPKVFARNNITSPPECLPPADAYTGAPPLLEPPPHEFPVVPKPSPSPEAVAR